MYKRKKQRQKKILIISLIIIVTVFIFTNLFMTGKFNYIGKIGKDAILFVENIITTPIKYTKRQIKNTKELKNIRKKYIELENTYGDYNLIKSENEELKKELQDLKEQLNINQLLSDKIKINATVTNRNIDYWYNTLTIDKGSKDGIKNDMAVLYKGYLIGKVTDTSYSNSIIRLITNNEVNKISVKIKIGENYIYGLLVGYDYKKDIYKIEGIEGLIDIPVDAEVLTTGFGSIYPSGIVIGKVSGVTTDNFDLTKIVEVKPEFNIDDINHVIVVSKDNNETSN